jgi:hypothetical protein
LAEQGINKRKNKETEEERRRSQILPDEAREGQRKKNGEVGIYISSVNLKER